MKKLELYPTVGLAKCGALFFPKWASKVGFEVGKFETGWAKSHFIFFEVGYDVGFSGVKWVFCIFLIDFS